MPSQCNVDRVSRLHFPIIHLIELCDLYVLPAATYGDADLLEYRVEYHECVFRYKFRNSLNERAKHHSHMTCSLLPLHNVNQ